MERPDGWRGRVGDWFVAPAKLIRLYRESTRRDARREQAIDGVGRDAFLSGHDGWFFHRGLVRRPGPHD